MADEGDEVYTASEVVYNQEIPENTVDLVRKEYKRYKRKKPPPDLSEVINFEDPSTFRGNVAKYEVKHLQHSKCGLRCTTQWQMHELTCCPGFIFIVDPFLPGAQQYWTRRCIADFPGKPNVCNLDAHVTLESSQSVWELSQRDGDHCGLMDKLRWVHLGYQFDYNTVDYKPEKYYGFPSDLAKLMQHIAKAIGYADYSPETGIVNYYPLGSSMGGHTDHYEADLSWPLISLSFGQSAIFLIGGAKRDIKPTALYIHSGDIVIMSGRARTAFHAVPRIVKVGKEYEPPACLKWNPEIFGKGVANEFHSNFKAPSNRALSSPSPAFDVEDIPDASPRYPDVDEEISAHKSNYTSGSDRITTTNNVAQVGELQNSEQYPCSKDISRVHKNDRYTKEFCEEAKIICGCSERFFPLEYMEFTSKVEWQKFELYLSKTRINVNVRQVHETGKTVNIISQ